MTDAAQKVLQGAQQAYANQQWELAANLCEQVLNHYPTLAEALLLCGIVNAKLNRPSTSLQALDEVLRQNPEQFDALVWSGMMHHQLGRFDDARERFQQANRLDPDALAPYVGILRGHRAVEGDRTLLGLATQALARHLEADDEARQLMYGIAKAYDDLGEYQLAIRVYDQANQMAARLQKPNGMDRAFHTLKLNEMMRVFSRQRLAHPFPEANQTGKPIFILGMIRSGTTLVEQILTRHTQILPGGELRFWVDHGFAVVLPGSPGLNTELAEFLGLEYLNLLNKITPGDARITDKMPMNYMLVGLIHLLFPTAPIIHCTRNPVDTCMSIYMTPYAAPPDFAYDRDEIAFGYREYRRIMDHWQRVLPHGRMLEVSYETLIEEPEPTIRRMLDYCQLAWDPACLTPEKNERVVDTPSKWQVRQPMYKTSVGRAKNYAPWLGAIGQLGELS